LGFNSGLKFLEDDYDWDEGKSKKGKWNRNYSIIEFYLGLKLVLLGME